MWPRKADGLIPSCCSAAAPVAPIVLVSARGTGTPGAAHAAAVAMERLIESSFTGGTHETHHRIADCPGRRCRGRNQEPSEQILAARGTQAPVQYSQEFSLPVGATTTTEVTGCDNSPGPNITIQGAMTLGGLGTRTTFTNNVKGTHTFATDAHVDITVIPNGGSITIPKQPVLGGVGGNPFIWIQFEDGNAQAVSGEIFLGRCVQGLRNSSSVDFSSLARTLATITVADCANSPGPFITVDGNLVVRSGLDAVFIFANNDNPVGGPHRATADAVVRITLVPPGMDIRFNKQPSREASVEIPGSGSTS